MKASNIALMGLCCLAFASQAQRLTPLQNGEIADADIVNGNFEQLRTGPDARDDNSYYQWHLKQISVDCTKDASAFDAIFEQTLHIQRVRYEITGICNPPTTQGDTNGYVRGVSSADAQGRFIQIAGDCNSSPGAGLQVVRVDGFSNQVLNANHGGTLYLKCLRLDVTGLQVFANSYVRLEGVTPLEDRPIDIFAYDGGVVRTFRPFLADNPDFSRNEINSVTAEGGAVLRIAGETNIGSVTLNSGSIARFTAISEIGSVTMNPGSVMQITSAGALGSLTARAATFTIESTAFSTASADLSWDSKGIVRCLSSNTEGVCIENSIQNPPTLDEGSKIFTY